MQLCVGYDEPETGRRWFLSRSPGVGNLLRTRSPLSARTWDSLAELRQWLDSLPPVAKAQLAGKKLLLTPIWAQVGDPLSSYEFIPEPELKPAKNPEPEEILW